MEVVSHSELSLVAEQDMCIREVMYGIHETAS